MPSELLCNVFAMSDLLYDHVHINLCKLHKDPVCVGLPLYSAGNILKIPNDSLPERSQVLGQVTA